MFAHIYFLFEYVIRLYASKSCAKYLFTLESQIDIITTVPYIILHAIYGNDINSYVMFANMLDIFRILALSRLLKQIESDINRELLNIMLFITSLALTTSAFV